MIEVKLAVIDTIIAHSFTLCSMKREVASSLVERGVTERVRLTKTYENKRDELVRQHELIKNALSDHQSKVPIHCRRR